MTHSPQEAGLQHLPSLEKVTGSPSTFSSLKDTIRYDTIIYYNRPDYTILCYTVIPYCTNVLYYAIKDIELELKKNIDKKAAAEVQTATEVL